MKKTKLTLNELSVASFATTDKITARGGEDNPTCLPDSCTGCDAIADFA
ncbi:hypothetical protein AB9P05_02165 [Roseivirga sp. BDSF3-8]